MTNFDTNHTQEAYPGQNIRLKATAYDQYHQPTTAFIRIRNAEESNSNTTNTTIFEPSIVPVPLSEGTITFHYLRADDKAYTEESISFFDPFFHSSDEVCVIIVCLLFVHSFVCYHCFFVHYCFRCLFVCLFICLFVCCV